MSFSLSLSLSYSCTLRFKTVCLRTSSSPILHVLCHNTVILKKGDSLKDILRFMDIRPRPSGDLCFALASSKLLHRTHKSIDTKTQIWNVSIGRKNVSMLLPALSHSRARFYPHRVRVRYVCYKFASNANTLMRYVNDINISYMRLSYYHVNHFLSTLVRYIDTSRCNDTRNAWSISTCKLEGKASNVVSTNAFSSFSQARLISFFQINDTNISA